MEKCWKKQCIVLAIFQHFSFGPPLETMKKSCLNELKFWEASRNQNWSICWKFQYSISKIGESPLISGSSFPNRDPQKGIHNEKFKKKIYIFIWFSSEVWKVTSVNYPYNDAFSYMNIKKGFSTILIWFRGLLHRKHRIYKRQYTDCLCLKGIISQPLAW